MTHPRKAQAESDLSGEEQRRVRVALKHIHARLGDWRLVAKVLRYARSTVADTACGNAAVTASMAFRIARFLGVPIDALINGDFTPPSVCPYCKQPVPEDAAH